MSVCEAIGWETASQAAAASASPSASLLPLPPFSRLPSRAPLPTPLHYSNKQATKTRYLALTTLTNERITRPTARPLDPRPDLSIMSTPNDSDPPEVEVFPGVYLTDFRTRVDSRAAHTDATLRTATHIVERKQKEEADTRDVQEDESTPSAVAAAASVAAPSSSSLSLERDVPSAFPRDIPNDVESLELEREALERNLMQLLRSNDALRDELRTQPDDADFVDAVRENCVVIERRAARLDEIQQEMRNLGAHSAQHENAALRDAMQQHREKMREEAQHQQQEQQAEGGIFL